MKVGKNVKGIVGLQTPVMKFEVVVGSGPQAGRIKTIPLDVHIQSPILHDQWRTGEGGRKQRLDAVHLKQQYLDEGWMILEEEFKKAGMEEEWEQYQLWKQSIASGYDTAEWPDEMLPPSVIKCRENKKRVGWKPPEKFVPTSSKGKRKKKGAKAQPTQKPDPTTSEELEDEIEEVLGMPSEEA